MQVKVEPKLKFEVGEEVVICGHSSSYLGNYNYPNEDEFTFTTIKEIREDGSVVVAEGYRFKQASKTQFGFTDVYDYFKIDRQRDNIKFNNKKYFKSYDMDARIEDECVFYFGPVYLYKKSDVFTNKRIKYEEEYKHFLEEDRRLKEARAIIEAKEKPFKDAYKEVVEPLKEEYERKLNEAWKEYFCKSCKHNHQGACCKWEINVAKADIGTCSAWEVK